MKVEVRNLERNFTTNKAVDNISFSIETGSIYGFIGPNGAGKTTTMNIMATLDYPCSGDVFYDGCSAVLFPEKVRPFIGFMPDTLPSSKTIRVWEYLDFFARSYKLRGKSKTKILSQIEEFTGLGCMREKFLNQLSKGMKQRVNLARALVHDPEVLILDEPAAGLDPRARMELRKLIKILAGQKKAIIISSHILSEMQGLCDGTIIIEKGKLLKAGSIKEISKEIERKSTTVSVKTLSDQKVDIKKILQLTNVRSAKLALDKEILIDIEGGDKECAQLATEMVNAKISFFELTKHSVGIEDLFMNITKGEVQ